MEKGNTQLPSAASAAAVTLCWVSVEKSGTCRRGRSGKQGLFSLSSMLLARPGPQFVRARETFAESLLLAATLLMSISVFSSLLNLMMVSWGIWVFLVLHFPLFHRL